MNPSEKLQNAPLANHEIIKQEVIELLDQYHIPYAQWGTGAAKTLDHLVKEVMEGETILQEMPEGLVRKITINTIDVYYNLPEGTTLHLIEEKQIFKDGRERRRPPARDASLSEKLKMGEMPSHESVARALKEELGITGNATIVSGKSEEATENSPSYPDLMTHTMISRYSVHLLDNQYNPQGYVEHQADKDVYFIWKPLNEK